MDNTFLEKLYQANKETWQPLAAAASILATGFALVFLILFARSWSKFVMAFMLLIVTLVFVKITTRNIRVKND